MHIQNDDQIHGDQTPDLVDLTEAERFVVRSMRKWLFGYRFEKHHVWDCMWKDFKITFGEEDGCKIVTSVSAIISTLLKNANHKIRFHQPCCPCLVLDEYFLVRFVAACQHKDWPQAHAAASCLVSEDGIGDFLVAGSRLGKAMSRHALQLPEDRINEFIFDNSRSHYVH